LLVRELRFPDQLELVGDLEDHTGAVGRHPDPLEHTRQHRAEARPVFGEQPTEEEAARVVHFPTAVDAHHRDGIAVRAANP
jgi:hypothetical protein